MRPGVVLLAAACGAGSPAASPTAQEQAMTDAAMTVESTLEATRGGTTARIIVRASVPVNDSPHLVAAAARAWLSSGRALLASGDAAGAWEASQQGLTELGNAYRDPRKIDDTGQKLSAAKMRYHDGQVADAATIALTALESRIGQYQRNHAAEVVAITD